MSMNNFMPAQDVQESIVNILRYGCCRKELGNIATDKKIKDLIIFYGRNGRNAFGSDELSLEYDSPAHVLEVYPIIKKYANANYHTIYEFNDISNTLIFNIDHIDFLQKHSDTELILGYDDLDICLSYPTAENLNADLQAFIHMLIKNL